MDKAMQVALDATVQGWVKSGQAEALAAALAAHLGLRLVPEGAEVAPAGWRATGYAPIEPGAYGLVALAADGASWLAYRQSRGGVLVNGEGATAQAAADAVAALQEGAEPAEEPSP